MVYRKGRVDNGGTHPRPSLDGRASGNWGPSDMARLIEAQQMQALPGRVTMEVGDLLLVGATGAHLLSGSDVVEVLGPALSSILAPDGSILSPAGPPNTVLLRALRPGDATIEILGGDPFQGTHSTTLEVVVTA